MDPEHTLGERRHCGIEQEIRADLGHLAGPFGVDPAQEVLVPRQPAAGAGQCSLERGFDVTGHHDSEQLRSRGNAVSHEVAP